MRQIKFRSWTYYQGDIHDGEMDYEPCLDGYNSDYCADLNSQLNDTDKVNFASCDQKAKQSRKGGFYQVLFLQFTGLTDVNDKEIWEGDIVALFTDKEIVDGRAIDKAQYHVGVVRFDNGGFYLDFGKGPNDTDLMMFWYIDGCEKIGNIYETPELIEVK